MPMDTMRRHRSPTRRGCRAPLPNWCPLTKQYRPQKMVSMRYAAVIQMADYQNTTGPIFGPPHRESALERYDPASCGAEERALGAAPEPSFPAADGGHDRLPPRRRCLPDCPHLAGLPPVELTPGPQFRRDR